MATKTAITTFNPRFVDQAGSFLDARALSHASLACKRLHWIFQARMQMLLYVKDPKKREEAIVSVGLAIVYDKKDQRPHLIKIFQVSQGYFTAISTRGNRELGWITFECQTTTGGVSDVYSGKDLQNIYVKRVLGTQDCSGVGTALMQAAGMEWGLMGGRDCNIRLYLEAAWKSPPFYWNLGMRTTSSNNTGLIIASSLRKGLKRVDQDFGCPKMLLPVDKASEWQHRLCQDPILYNTRIFVDLIQRYIPNATLVLSYASSFADECTQSPIRTPDAFRHPKAFDLATSFLDTSSLNALRNTCTSAQKIFQARLQIQVHLRKPPRDKETVGYALVYKKDDQLPCLAKITMSGKYGTKDFRLILTKTNESLGTISLYPDNSIEASYIFSNTHSEVDTALLQAVLERVSKRGSLDMQITADATNPKTAVFLKTSGMQLKDEETMILTPEATIKWRERIQSNPILIETRKQLKNPTGS